MNQLKLIKEPGYLLDLLFVFSLHFNKQRFFDQLTDESTRIDEEEYYNSILNLFDPISDDLFIFFTSFQDGRSFLDISTFTNYQSTPPADFCVDFLQSKLSDYQFVIKKMIKFCFRELTAEDLEACTQSNIVLFPHIKKSTYPDKIKNALYEFFIDPIPYIQKLQSELVTKNMQLSSYYEKNYQTLLDLYMSLSSHTHLEEHLHYLWDLSRLDQANVQSYASFCLLNKSCVRLTVTKTSAIYLLGRNYADTLYSKQRQTAWLNLEEFGAAIGEESRVSIMNYILEHGEVNCKDLEKAFHFSGSTVYHHLTIMLKARVLKRRHEGKTVLYSINRKYMDAVIELLQKYSSSSK